MSTDLEFSDFTRENYRRLLRMAKASYTFRSFANAASGERCIYWRHDIDISPHAAVALAKIEAEEGVTATYFLLLHSEFYNLFEASVTERIKAIASLGHSFGLHFDSTYYQLESESQLEAPLRREKRLIEDMFGFSLHAFSFHNTNSFTGRCVAPSYAGMVNVYSDHFRSEVGYVSDSNGYWRYRRLEDVLLAAEDYSLQVLTHPVWWQAEPMSPWDRVERCIQGRAKATRSRYDALLAAAGRDNVRTG